MRLEARGITAGYGEQPVIFDVSATFAERSITSIIGPNGAGKSTLLKSLFGLARVYAGTVAVGDDELVRPEARDLVRRGVGYVPQLGNIFPSLSVRENLELGGYVRSGGSIERVLAIFADLGPVLRKPAGKLSGGQRQMLAVGRALMSDPQVLLLDEATAGLSPMISGSLWQHIRALADGGLAIAVVEQNVGLALQFSDTVYLLTSGRNRLDGPASAFRTRTDLDQLFLEAGPAEAEPAAGVRR
ncbi:MAG TPA: ABC transporter ATP-binding protein [Candidatus Limnocylindria bacterium]|nr:ABC transporter ATP-binding protein [Candidatus Limnocylindria bacterium]